MAEKKLNGTVIVTYRCNARCSMCNRYKAPSKAEEEISIDTIKKLPKMLVKAYKTGKYTDMTDETRIMYEEYGITPTFVEGGENLYKVTYPHDIEYLEFYF